MNASFEEKSVRVQLIATVVGLGAYFAIAGLMIDAGVTALPAFVPLFMATVVLMVMVLVIGHALAAVLGRPEPRDERDRLISWRAESKSSWVIVAGVFTAITGMVFSVENLWIAHFLLLSVVLSQVLAFVLQIVYYRRGTRGS